jgi:predicted O-methyltransferase YrrM
MRAPTGSEVPFGSPAKRLARRAVFAVAEKAGLRLEALEDTDEFVADHSSTSVALQHRMDQTPGMITLRRGMYLYWLAYATPPGDVIELGSWQGRSTIALAQACADTGNGVVHAVDTFKGNPGNEQSYVVSNPDLSDLERNFRENMRRAGLADRVETYPMRSDEAAPILAEKVGQARMIYIDAEHTYEAVAEELELYAPMVVPGGILCFDDYSQHFEGVARAIGEHLAAHPGRYARPAQDRNFLVVRRVS